MARKKRDDLFEESSMTFGEHLTELRIRIIRALYWLVGGIIIALIPGSWVIPGSGYGSMAGWAVDFIQRPLTRSLKTYYIDRSSEKIKKQAETLRKMGYSEDIALIPTKMGMAEKEIWLFPEDLARLRRLLATPQEGNKDSVETDAGASGVQGTPGTAPAAKTEPLLSNEQLLLLVDNFERFKPNRSGPSGGLENLGIGGGAPVPFLVWEKLDDDPRIRAKSLTMPETFSIFLRTAIYLGLLLGSPGLLYEFWAFVGAGLYEREKRYVYRFFPFSLGLFFAGAALAFFVVFEMVLSFLLTFNAGMNIDPEPRINDWLKLSMILPFGFGIGFQLPLVMFALYRLRIVTIKTYLEKWRVSVLIIAFCSMIFTPPDPWSMICMLSALIGLYFLGVFLCKLAPLPKSEFDEWDEAD